MAGAATAFAVLLFSSKTICGQPVADQLMITAVYVAAEERGRTYNDTFDLVHDASATVLLNLDDETKRDAWCSSVKGKL